MTKKATTAPRRRGRPRKNGGLPAVRESAPPPAPLTPPAAEEETPRAEGQAARPFAAFLAQWEIDRADAHARRAASHAAAAVALHRGAPNKGRAGREVTARAALAALEQSEARLEAAQR